MELSAKLVRAQLHFFKPFVANCSLETTRKGQDKLGELMSALHRREVYMKDHDFGPFQGAWVMPKDERRSGVVLYLHGGGYTCGSLEYAKGLRRHAGQPVRRAGVLRRLPASAGEPLPRRGGRCAGGLPLPAEKGLRPTADTAVRRGAGGGLIYALCLRLRQESMTLPCGLIGISPWVDLTGSGQSYETNRDNDPSLTQELLEFYAKCYTTDPTDPLCSPLFGDLTGFPPSLLFAGGDEILLDDARALQEKLVSCGCKSTLRVAPERWHAYVLYCLNENMEDDMAAIDRFLVPKPLPGPQSALDASGQRGQNIPRRQAAELEQLLPPVRHADGDGGYRGAAPRPGCHGAPLPSIAVRLRRGAFWYYLEEIPKAPPIQPEKSCPLAHAPFHEVRQCALPCAGVSPAHRRGVFHALPMARGR